MYRHNVESSDVFLYQAKMFCLSSEQYFLIGFQFVLVFGNNCTQGEYKTSDGQCCPMCNKGLVVRRDCKMESSTSCIPCIKGTFMNEANGLTKCFPCSPCDPGLGLFIQTQCIETSNTVCDVLDGYYCRSYSSNSECSFAVEHTHCSPGQRTKAPGTKTTDTMCEECQDGFYSQHGANCTAWTEHMIYHTRSQGWLTGNSFGLYGVRDEAMDVSCCAAMGHVKTKDGDSRQDIVCNNVPSRNYDTLIVPVSFVLTVTALFGFNLARAKLKKEIVEIHVVPVQETEQHQVTSNSPVETAENVPRNVVTDVLLNPDDVPRMHADECKSLNLERGETVFPGDYMN